MSKDLWIPPINPSDDLIQKEVCNQQQNKINLTTYDGGCYGVICNECILDVVNLSTFSIWTVFGVPLSSQPKQTQFDLFNE